MFKDKLVLLTVNQLLLGRTSFTPPPDHELPGEDFRTAGMYLHSLTQSWWKLWMEQGFPTLLPYYKYKDTKRHENLQVNDVCLIKYENKVASTYRLCWVISWSLLGPLPWFFNGCGDLVLVLDQADVVHL